MVKDDMKGKDIRGAEGVKGSEGGEGLKAGLGPKGPRKLSGLARGLLLALGLLSLILGGLGVFLPVLPTTPFLLLSSFCFLRSSSRLYDWLMGHRIFGPYLYCYLTYKGVPRKTKISALVFLWAMLIISMVWVGRLWVTGLLLLVGTGVSIHLVHLRCLTEEELRELEVRYPSKAGKSARASTREKAKAYGQTRMKDEGKGRSASLSPGKGGKGFD